MKTILYMLLLTISLTTFADYPPHDVKAIQGKWKPIKGDLGGQPMDAAVMKIISLKMDNRKYEVIVGNEPDRGTHRIDPTHPTREHDYHWHRGANQGRIFPAIFDLEGNTLRIC